MMLQVVEINAIEHLEAIRLRWKSLLYETPGGSFFHTLDWLKVYWQHFRDGHQLRVLLVHRGGTVLGILPLVVRKEMTVAGLGDVLTYPTIDPSQFCGPVGPNPTATLLASIRHLAGASRDWDLLSLGRIGEHDHGRTVNALELAGFCPLESVRATVSKVCFDESFSEHLTERGAEIAGALRFERTRPLGSSYGDDQPLEAAIDECILLHRQSSTAEPSDALLRDVITTASRLGMLDLNLLRLDGRLVAFSLNVHFEGATQQICFGQTATSHPLQPASVLTGRMLQDSFSRKDRHIYFADSIDGFTNLWATQRLPVIRYQHRVATPFRTQLSRLGQWLTSPLANA